jgi:hypothetical protein
MNNIEIGFPYVTKDKENVRLNYSIKVPGKESSIIYYEVPIEFESYLDTESVDAAVLATMNYAMYFGFNIRSEAPMSERLWYQLTYYYIPIVNKFISYYRYIYIY